MFYFDVSNNLAFFKKMNVQFDDKIYVQACANEVQLKGARFIAPENRIGRYDKKLKDAVVREECSSKNYKFSESGDLCTYDGTLKYFPYTFKTNCGSVDTSQFWDNVGNNIESIQKQKQQDGENKQDVFILVTHHSRLKQTILKLDKKQKSAINSYANATAIEVNFNTENIDINLIFDGYGDSVEKNYATTKNFTRNVLTEDTKKALQELGEKLKSSNVSVIIIRHGNALHNNPVNAKDILYRSPLDSSLTPLGHVQASLAGTAIYEKCIKKYKNVHLYLLSSYLSRAQHTAVAIAASLAACAHMRLPDKLQAFLHQMNIESMNRYRKYTDDVQRNQIESEIAKIKLDSDKNNEDNDSDSDNEELASD